MIQHLERRGASADHQVAYVIGSGTHAFGYLVQVGDHLFQSPISYYTKRGIWDMAPGYEEDRRPDFDYPITAGCLFCHAGQAKPIRGTLNRYEIPPFEDEVVKAIHNLERALQIESLLKAAYQKLAEIYLQDHDRAKLRETFERYLKAFPGSIEAQVALRTIGSTSP